MTRRLVVVSLLLGAVLATTPALSAPPEANGASTLHTEAGSPIIGYLKTQDGKQPLSREFFDASDADPDPGVYRATVMADIDASALGRADGPNGRR